MRVIVRSSVDSRGGTIQQSVGSAPPGSFGSGTIPTRFRVRPPRTRRAYCLAKKPASKSVTNSDARTSGSPTGSKAKQAADSHAHTEPTADYRHKTARRKNNPPAKIAAEGTVPAIPKARYAYSPHLAPILRFDPTADADRASAKVAALIERAAKGPLSAEDRAVLAEALANREPWLEWATKREQHQRGYFEVDPVALHIHERVSAQAVMRVASRQDVTHSLFADPEQQYHEAVQFYRHDIDWTNRLILGDSLQVMSSLARREDLAGKVQMIYMDPPYGIKFASNFQPLIRSRSVKDTEDDLTREPEMVRAYRDTWHLGVHSYLSYVRDRMLAAKEMLAPSGSLFVQISDENLHRVRAILDEVFGADNFVCLIVIKKTSPLGSKGLASVADYALWYCRDRDAMKFRDVFVEHAIGSDRYFSVVEELSGNRRPMEAKEFANPLSLPGGSRVLASDNLQSSGLTPSCVFDVAWGGKSYSPPSNKSWRTNPGGMSRLFSADRLTATGDTVRYVTYFDDFSCERLFNLWTDTGGGAMVAQKMYVVQTPTKVIERCMLMTTDPGDLVLDPTCGSGTTAFVAEQWGRRWIAIDTSRVAVAIARQRLLTAKFDYFKTKTPENQPNGNPAVGFKYKTVPHITLKSIAQNTNLDPIFAKHEPLLDAALAATNKALEKVTDATRTALCAKLAAKVADEGTSSLTDADDRRWLLPKTKPDAVTSAIVTAFGKKHKKPPTGKQIKAITDCIPQKAEVGKSSVPADGNGWEHWQVPFDTDPDWPKELQQAVTEYRKAWRAKMDEVNACIAANAEQEELVDQPEIVKNVTRVSGPFTVEAVQPPELSLGDPVKVEDDQSGEFAGAPGELNAMDGEFSVRFVETQGDIETKNAAAYLKQMFDLLKKDGVRFLNNKQMQWTRLDPLFEAGGSGGIHAEGAWIVSGGKGPDAGEVPDATVAVVFGPQYGPVTAKMVEELIRVAGRAKYEDLVIAGFSFDGAATAVIDEAGGDGKGLRLAGGHVIRVHMAHIRPDVNPGMNGLLKEQPGSQLFTVFGQPRIKVRGPGRKGGAGDQKTGEPPEGEYTVEMQGVDIYDPVRNVVEPTNAGKVAAWFLDSDYDGRTFCITQAFFSRIARRGRS